MPGFRATGSRANGRRAQAMRCEVWKGVTLRMGSEEGAVPLPRNFFALLVLKRHRTNNNIMSIQNQTDYRTTGKSPINEQVNR